MNQPDPDKPLTDLLDAGTTLMVGTGSGADLEFRPLTVAGLRGDVIEILIDSRAPWAQALRDGDQVQVTLSDERSNDWMWLRGTAQITSEPSAIDAIWNPYAGAYFDEGRETPGIAVLRIDGDEGRYWSSPSGRIGTLISMVKAKLGDSDDSGQHGDVALS
jgi:general stress protein 26